jgi:hypothetical protein
VAAHRDWQAGGAAAKAEQELNPRPAVPELQWLPGAGAKTRMESAPA